MRKVWRRWCACRALDASYAAATYGIPEAVTHRVGPTAYDVGAPGSDWVATLHLAQPVR
jgi:hypothetical protein